jgi:[ribosomal protein S18]-alanine N-acetyltransferase
MSDLPELVSVVQAGIGDAGSLARLHASLFDAAWDAASLREMLAHPGAVAFVAQAGNPPQIAGFIVGRVAADEAEMLAIAVARNRQRAGIGRRLVEALALAVNEKGARRLYLEVAAGNSAGRALYNRLGFEEIGRRRGYYVRAGVPTEDAVNLCLTLDRFAARKRGGLRREPHL